MDNKNRVYIVGIGPGEEEQMTGQALKALEEADVIVGYPVYLQLLGKRFCAKRKLSTPMRQEVERCRMCFEEASTGKTVALVCSGDAGIYGLASLMYEMGIAYPDCELTVVPGITAASSGAALLGAPVNHDFCVISLSDLLTPWEKIEARLRAAAQGDFVIVLYNPASHKRPEHLSHACDILLEVLPADTVCGYAENIGRDGTRTQLCSLLQLRTKQLNMFTTVFIGSRSTRNINGRMVTGRGYQV